MSVIAELRARKLAQRANDGVPDCDILRLNCDPHGFGDAVLGVWLAYGSQYSRPRLLLHTTQDSKRELIEMFGLDVADESDHSFSMFPQDVRSKGMPPRLWDWAAHLTSPFYRIPPTHNLSCREIDEARAKWGSVKYLLCPESAHSLREWPRPYWEELKAHLGNDRCLCLTQRREWRYGTGSLAMREIAALMMSTEVIIGVDSFPVHLAGTLGKPSIAIMGPEGPGVFAHLPSVRVLSVDSRVLPCVHCYRDWIHNKEVCYYNCAAMSCVTPEDVVQRVKELSCETTSAPS